MLVAGKFEEIVVPSPTYLLRNLPNASLVLYTNLELELLQTLDYTLCYVLPIDIISIYCFEHNLHDDIVQRCSFILACLLVTDLL